MITIKMKDHSPYLRFRNEYQRFSEKDKTAKDFIKENKFLHTKEFWENDDVVVMDFEGVKTVSPGWANEVFAEMAKWASIELFEKKIKLDNIHKVHRMIIEVEFKAGHGIPISYNLD